MLTFSPKRQKSVLSCQKGLKISREHLTRNKSNQQTVALVFLSRNADKNGQASYFKCSLLTV